jgi:hypothetical protein
LKTAEAISRRPEHARVVALNNDRDQYRIVLDRIAEDAIIERHESNGPLFKAFFEKPGFRDVPRIPRRFVRRDPRGRCLVGRIVDRISSLTEASSEPG